MHTVVLFGLSVSEFFNLSPFFLELSTTFKDILNFGFLGFIWTFGDSKRSFISDETRQAEVGRERRDKDKSPVWTNLAPDRCVGHT